MSILFISDLHLSPHYPHFTKKFFYFLEHYAEKAEKLYILGDFFEAWVGDDDDNDFNRPIKTALKKLSDKIPIYFIHGNRDFLIGERFAKETGCQLLPDPSVIDLYGYPTLLMHGDTLCTNDKQYQRFRRLTRSVFLQTLFLKLPLSWRKNIANALRAQAKDEFNNRYDATQAAIKTTFQQHAVQLLIHGHTHQPIQETLDVDGKKVERIVLSAWGEKGNALVCDETGKKELIYF